MLRRHPTRAFVGLVLACTLVVGCSLLKKKQDPGDDKDPAAANAPQVTVTGSGAKNEKDVLRYGNETKLADEPATIGKDGTKAKTFPASGQDVATLAKGTAVVKLATFFSTGVLVRFDDPATADGTKLMGWIAPEALGTAAAVATAAPAFTAAKVGIDAGPKDAGAIGVVDAGRAATTDAGSPNAGTGGRIQAPLGPDGKCPTGFISFGPACRRLCTKDSDCPSSAACTSVTSGKKTCSVK